MNGESSFEPNFVLVDEENETDSPESDVFEQTNELSVESEDGLPVTSNELEYIKKKRKKLRLFDPAGVYDFRHVEIGYMHSLWHVLTLCCSLVLFYGLYLLNITEAKVVITGLGEVSDLSVLDMIGLTFITIYPLIKIRQILTTKASDYNKRYQLSMSANAFNFIALNIIKLLIFLSALDLAIITVTYGELPVSVALEKLSNGVVFDSFSIVLWVISMIIIVKAFKYCGKGKEETQ